MRRPAISPSSGKPQRFIELELQDEQNPSIGGINVAFANGNNVLDSYANASFLTDGSGTDQDYLDIRALTQDIWSTVVNFHSGDNVTVWAVTQAGFTLDWIGDIQGGPGLTGLTNVFVSTTAGRPEAALTIAGFKMADLTDGKLSISYSTIGGTPYASIHANQTQMLKIASGSVN